MWKGEEKKLMIFFFDEASLDYKFYKSKLKFQMIIIWKVTLPSKYKFRDS